MLYFERKCSLLGKIFNDTRFLNTPLLPALAEIIFLPLQDGIEMGLFHEELQAAKLQTQERVPKMVVILMTARDIAAGLEHVHSHHILHGDLTAGNVLLASTPAGVQGARSFTAKVSQLQFHHPADPLSRTYCVSSAYLRDA